MEHIVNISTWDESIDDASKYITWYMNTSWYKGVDDLKADFEKVNKEIQLKVSEVKDLKTKMESSNETPKVINFATTNQLNYIWISVFLVLVLIIGVLLYKCIKGRKIDRREQTITRIVGERPVTEL